MTRIKGLVLALVAALTLTGGVATVAQAAKAPAKKAALTEKERERQEELKEKEQERIEEVRERLKEHNELAREKAKEHSANHVEVAGCATPVVRAISPFEVTRTE